MLLITEREEGFSYKYGDRTLQPITARLSHATVERKRNVSLLQLWEAGGGKRMAEQAREELDLSPQMKNLDEESVNRLNMSIEILKSTKRTRFMQVKEYGDKLIELISVVNTHAELDIVDVIGLIDASSVEDVIEKRALSPSLLSKVKAEVSRLEQVKAKDLESKILRKKDKIRALMRKTHLFEKDLNIILLKKDMAKVLLEKVEKWENNAPKFSYDAEHLMPLLLFLNNDGHRQEHKGQKPARVLLPLLPLFPRYPRTPRMPVAAAASPVPAVPLELTDVSELPVPAADATTLPQYSCIAIG
uniref:Uncharacterized protein n=1 Tax=Leersia perrieri TaxID=77586 RepID=A0A0D9WJ21_9ORYZ